jgi:hypothetical protein
MRETELRRQVVGAIKLMQERIRWKTDKDVSHLATRIEYGHLPPSATMADYEAIISEILRSETAEVYVYHWGDNVYPTVSHFHEERQWLVIFSLAGVMETAFPPTYPEEYLADPRFQLLGTVRELLS